MNRVAAWKGTTIRAAEARAVRVAGEQGDPDRYMRRAAHALAVTVLRRLGPAGPGPVSVRGPERVRTEAAAMSGTGVAGRRIVILAGPGGNGGDGLYAGAILARRGAAVTAVSLVGKEHPRARAAFLEAGGRLRRVGAAATAALGSAEVVIDAGFGTGARGGLADEVAEWPEAAWVVAADAPSGLDTDTGELPDVGHTPHADVTVTFGALKTGLVLGRGRGLCGDVVVHELPGLLDPVVMGEPELRVVGEAEARDSVLSPTPADHKYSRGVLGMVAGSPQYPGAGVLAARAALATGVGMLTAFSRDRARDVLTQAVPEAVIVQDESNASPSEHPRAARVAAWLVGPGLGDEARDLEPVTALLKGPQDVPVVVDASGLACVPPAQDGVRPWLLTPHAGELHGLSQRLGLGLPDPVRHPEDAVTQAADRLRCAVLLKGSTTLVAAPGEVLAACSAGPELAVAGSGDTLSGIIGALVATRAARTPLGPHELAELGARAAVLHGLAGARAVEQGEPGAAGLAPGLSSVLLGIRGVHRNP